MKFPPLGLYHWYAQHARSLPWRQEKHPYAIWISEVILQQTRVKQGLDYYLAFMARFPTVQHLAAATEQDVLKAWEGLGYYSRARNLQAAARQLVADHGGEFPRNWEALMQLKGVGPYTARAIASFAFGQRAAVLDGNVFRVLSRLYADDTPIDSTRARPHYQQLADELMAQAPDPALHNQAMMELGATLCTVHNPACIYCPMQSDCEGYASGRPTQWPLKGIRKEVATRHFIFWPMMQDGTLALVQRNAGFWRGLYVFPHAEVTEQEVPRQAWVQDLHIFTHFRMHMYVCPGQPTSLPADVTRILPTQTDNYPLPRAMHKLLAALQDKGIV